MAETWTISRVLAWTADRFAKDAIESPRLTAELLLGHVLACDRVRLYTDFDRPLEGAELAAYRGLIARRIAGESTWYLVGSRHFRGRRFLVDRRVLVPRPETELLVERALALAPGFSSALDLCTGTGCIALSLAAERPEATVAAVELSEDALAVAHENAAALGLEGRVEWLHGDLATPVTGRAFDLVISNPPYIASIVLESLPPEVRCEPRAALDGGPDGLEVIRRIASAAPTLLHPGGLLALEIGEDQGETVTTLLTRTGLADVRVEKDWAERDRFAFAVRASEG